MFLIIIIFLLFSLPVNAASDEEIHATNCCSSVLFLPGFEGNRLYEGNNQLWEPNFIRDIDKLGFDSEGKSINKDISVGEIIKRTNVGFGFFDKSIYQGISDDLDKLVSEGNIKEWKAISYDWREDLPIPSYFSQLMHDMAERSYTGKITIIGHSNGGLLAKKFTSILGSSLRKEILDSVISIATPQTGSVSGLAALLHGDEQDIAGGFIASNGAMREMGKNMPAAYNFIPSRSFYESSQSPLITFATSTDLVSNLRKSYNNLIDSYDTMRSFVLGEKDHRLPPSKTDILIPEVLNSVLLDTSEYNHWRLDTHTGPYSSAHVDDLDYPLYQIGGTNFPTTSLIDYFSHVYNNKTKLTHVNIRDDEGDGVVQIKSALFEKNATSSFLFDLGKYNEDYHKNLSHSDIMEAFPIRSLVTSIIKKSTSTSPYITSIPKSSSEGVIYRFGTHSPVTLDVYDLAGRHTGKVKSSNPSSDLSYVEAQIPNSVYEEIGDESYITISNPKGIITFKINGLAAGTFTFDAIVRHRSGPRFLPEDKKIILFKDIEVQKESGGEVVFNPSDPSSVELGMDTDNDGSTDLIIPNQAEGVESGFVSSGKPQSTLGSLGRHRRTPEYLQYIKHLFESLLKIH